MLLAVLGIAVMVGVPRGGNALGELMALLSPLSFAVVIVVARRHRDVSMTPATALAQLMLIVFVLPFVHAGQLHGSDVGWLALLGLGQQGFGLVFFTIGARLIPAAEVALITLLEIVLGPLWVWLLYREDPGIPTLAGGAVILAAVLLHALADLRRPSGLMARAESL